MLNKVNIIEVNDWSPIKSLKYDENIFCYKDGNKVDTTNLGIYLDDRNRYRSCGYAGICILKDKYDNDYIGTDGKKIILVVNPRFRISPWTMLAEVMHDEEYDSYMDGSDKKIYEIMENEKPLKMNIDNVGGEILLVISFIRSCYKICSGILNRKMSFVSKNLNGKVKGRIDIPSHIKKNVVRGREDKIYCKYPYFSEDTVENRILKKALVECERILYVNQCMEVDGLSKVREMLIYCKNRLKGVSAVMIKKSDFSGAKTKGFNAVYEPAIKLADIVLGHSSMSVNVKGEKTGYVLPYAIKMESIFEFYARTKIKQYLSTSGLENIRLDKYRDISHKADLLKTVDNTSTYLMQNYIPDIALQIYNSDTEEWEYAAVMDVKYQRSTSAVNSETRRHNSHQLMFYTLLLDVKKCGFIFPLESNVEYTSDSEQMILQNGNAGGPVRQYAEFHIGDNADVQKSEIEEIMKYVLEI